MIDKSKPKKTNLWTVVPWSTIIKTAKKCGKLRIEGKIKEAEELEKYLKEVVYSADEVPLDV